MSSGNIMLAVFRSVMITIVLHDAADRDQAMRADVLGHRAHARDRRPQGARRARREILWQFPVEAAFLTSAGGPMGILFGSSMFLRR